MKKIIIISMTLITFLGYTILFNLNPIVEAQEVKTIGNQIKDDYFFGLSDEEWDYFAIMYDKYDKISDSQDKTKEEYMYDVYMSVMDKNSKPEYLGVFSVKTELNNSVIKQSRDAVETEKIDLNPSEIGVCILHPVACLIAESDADTAVEKTIEIYGENTADTDADAFRHAYWNALMRLAITESVVEAIATAHEAESTGLPHDMDLYNNQMGRTKYEIWAIRSKPYISVTERSNDLSIFISYQVRLGKTVKIEGEELVPTTEGEIYVYPSVC